MSRLKDKLFQKIVAHRHRIARLVRENGKVLIDQVTIEQCIGGARDIRSLVTDISLRRSLGLPLPIIRPLRHSGTFF
jgi:citrate synthase